MTALLVSDKEREYTVNLLRGHWLSGRLTAEEFEQRVDEAWRARFASDLWEALRALPVDGPPAARPADAPPGARPAAGDAPAVASLVTGLLAIFLLAMSFGLLFVITLPLSVTAWALGREGRRSGSPQRRGMARTGEVLGIVGTTLGVLLLAGCAALVSAL